MIDASARQSSEDLTLERTYWASTGIEFSGMSRAESAPAMIADAFHQVGSLDRLRAAYAAPHWDWVQHAFPSCIFTQLCAALDEVPQPSRLPIIGRQETWGRNGPSANEA